MPRGVKILAAFGAGLLVGEALPVGYYILANNYFGVFDRDGGGAMGAIFIMGPISALLIGAVAALVVARRTARAAG